MSDTPLPIDPHLPTLVEAVRRGPGLVVIAEPGAGKTTRVPRALLEAGVAGDGEIVVLEPRRLAARLAARRVAQELGERLGERVGFTVRFDDVSSTATRLRFVTEGVLARRLAADPELAGVRVVVLDELHERHLHGDVALALLRRLQARRPELRLVAMSATLDAEPVARFLGAEVATVPGRSFPVTVEHAERESERPLHEQVAAAVRKLAREDPGGDVLVFLPGAGEIRRAEEALGEWARSLGFAVLPLHGDLPIEEQERAVGRSSRRKVILATNVAETSLTIDGVTAVVDSGLHRGARFSPWSGLSSLTVGKVSRASAIQRAGRGGRTAPGRCLRLYTRLDFEARPAFEAPEIKRADLAETALLLHALGEGDLGRFPWFEAPAAAALAAAETLLLRLGAVAEGGTLTPLGRRLLALPLHPRLGRLVVEAAAQGAARDGCLLAALLGEREIRLAARTRFGGAGAHLDASGPSDLLDRRDAFLAAEREGLRPERIRRLELDPGAVLAVARARDQIARALGRSSPTVASAEAEDRILLRATLAAFPDRVAKRRAPRSSEVVFAGGGGARMAETSVVREAPFLVAVEADDQARGVVVRLASAVEPDWLLDLFPERIAERDELAVLPGSGRVERTTALLYDGLVLDEERRPAAPGPATSRVLAEAALARGLDRLAGAEALAELGHRLAFAASLDPGLPTVDEQAIREAVAERFDGCTTLGELGPGDLVATLLSRLPPEQRRLLDRLAPERVTLPGGRRVAIHYAADQPPWLGSRLQDFFGLADGPRVGGGAVPVVLHLLAPNQRAVQVTTDLAGFWARHYPAIRRELMRRYPRHAWPEDPRTASPPPVTRRG